MTTCISFLRLSRNSRRVSICALGVLMFGLASTSAQPVIVTRLQAFQAGAVFSNPRSLVMGEVNGALYGAFFPSSSPPSPARMFTLNRDGSGYSQPFVISNRFLPAFEIQQDVPETRVIQGSDGELYGVTPYGGTHSRGFVFTMDANLSGHRVLHDFSTNGTPSSLIQGSDGTLYGVGINAVFRLNTDGSDYAELHKFAVSSDGGNSLGVLLQGSDGALYGANYEGGTNGFGTLFKISTNGVGFTVLHTFGDPGDGRNPFSGLIQGSDGALYGTTTGGGSAGKGTLFKINTDGSGYAVLHHFAGAPTDGATPYGELVEGLGGTLLFGTTYLGGVGNDERGTIFKIGLDGSDYSTIHSFTTNSPVGGRPITGLVRGRQQDDIGVYYGTTSLLTGFAGGGAVFAMLVNPPLSVTPVTGNAGEDQTVVFWPDWAINYQLQSTTNLNDPDWVTITDGTPVTGRQVTSTNPAVFYRLVSP